MDKVIDISVKGSYIRKNSNSAGIQGEGNVTILHITFDEGWESYAKKVTFWDSRGENPVERTLTADLLVDVSKSVLEYNVPIPAEPLVHEGEITFIIEGYIDGKRKRAAQDTLEVEPALVADNAGEPADPTPTQAEQLQKGIDAILSTVKADKNEAIAAANRAETEADNARSEAILAGQYAGSARESLESIGDSVETAAQAAEAAVSAKETAQAAANRAVQAETTVVNARDIVVAARDEVVDAKNTVTEAENVVVEVKRAVVDAERTVLEAANEVSENTKISTTNAQAAIRSAESAANSEANAKNYMEQAKEAAGGDFVTNGEFEETINNLEITSDKVNLTDEVKDSMNFRGDETLDDALTLISSALNEVYENMEQTSEALGDFLPLDGSKAMNGMLKFENGTGIIAVDYKQLFLAVMDDVFASGYGSRILTLFNAKYGKSNVADALVLTDMADDGSVTEYKIYGEHNKPKAADTGAINQKTVYYPASTNKSADDLTDGLALVSTSASLNSELATALGDTFAYVMTTMYSEDRRAQIAWTYGATVPRIAVRHIKGDGAWTAWKTPANKDECLPNSTVPINKGGTGATDAATARTNLGITPSNIGAVPSTGGTVSGVITAKQFSQSDYGNPLEIGAYIDMHKKGSTADFDMRLSINSDGSPNINIPNKGVYNLYGTHNITASTTDLTAGTSTLASGNLYLVYE